MSAGHDKYTAAIVALDVGLALLLIGGLERRLTQVHSLLRQDGPGGSRTSIAFLPCLRNTLCSSRHFCTGQEVGRIFEDRRVAGRLQVPVTETSISAELDVSTTEDLIRRRCGE